MTPAELAAIRARANNATQGPWEVRGLDGEIWQTEPYGPGPALVLTDEYVWEPNAVFIAHARSDIPALLDHVDRLTFWVKRWQEASEDNETEIDRLTARVDAARELHRKDLLYPEDEESALCEMCEWAWPCPTIQALDGN